MRQTALFRTWFKFGVGVLSWPPGQVALVGRGRVERRGDGVDARDQIVFVARFDVACAPVQMLHGGVKMQDGLVCEERGDLTRGNGFDAI